MLPEDFGHTKDHEIRFMVSAYLNAALQPFMSGTIEDLLEALPDILKDVIKFADVQGASRILQEDIRRNFLQSLQIKAQS